MDVLSGWPYATTILSAGRSVWYPLIKEAGLVAKSVQMLRRKLQPLLGIEP